MNGYEVRKGNSRNCYVVNSVKILSQQTIVVNSILTGAVLNAKKNMIKESLNCLRKNFDALKRCLCSKTYCCWDSLSNKFKFSGKRLNKRPFEDSGDGPIAKYRKVFHGTGNVTSTNRGLHTTNLCVATQELTNIGLSYIFFQPN